MFKELKAIVNGDEKKEQRDETPVLSQTSRTSKRVKMENGLIEVVEKTLIVEDGRQLLI